MITWNEFLLFSLPAVALWASGALLAWKQKRNTAILLTLAGTVVFAAFIAGLWIGLERPPLRTMGETRLWYSFFMPVAGIITYWRWRFKWVLSFSTVMSVVFVCINLFKPEIHSKALMPALQSPWFAPHVIVYMFAYAIMGAALLAALWMLYSKSNREMAMTDNLVNIGLAFITIGMLFGAVWAKDAWGHYWSWDPKETWAAATWFIYLLYVHQRHAYPLKHKAALLLLVVGFVCLQMCWWGINYLPSAQGASIHTYNLN